MLTASAGAAAAGVMVFAGYRDGPQAFPKRRFSWGLVPSILGHRPTALAIAKRSFNADSDNIRGIANAGLQALALYYQTDESREGTKAFLEKRKPQFRARTAK